MLEAFGFISGYKLNLSKSELFPVNAAAGAYPLHNFPFKVSRHGFTYHGIQVTNEFKSLFEASFTPCLECMQQDFDSWSLFTFSRKDRLC